MHCAAIPGLPILELWAWIREMRKRMFHMVQRTAADAAAVWKKPSAQEAYP